MTLKCPLIITVLSTALFINGCGKENFPGAEIPAPVLFTSSITTYTTENIWTTGDKIGIFMTTAGRMPGDSGGIVAGVDNYLFTASAGATAALVSDPSQPRIYYPSSGTVDFTAYYPYKASGAGADEIDDYLYPADVSDQSDLSAIDLLYAKAVGRSKSNDPVPLNFDHKLSKFVITIVKGSGKTESDFSQMEVTLEGMPNKAKFSLDDGQTFSEAESTAGIAMHKTIAGIVFQAILIPHDTSAGFAGRKAVFRLSGETYIWNIPDNLSFASGKEYFYTVTVNGSNTGTGIDIAPSESLITDWTGTQQLPAASRAVKIDAVRIRAGIFDMGSPAPEPERYDDESLHRVTLTKDFWMSKYQITNAQFAAFLNDMEIGANGQYNGNRLVSGDFSLGVFFDMSEGQWFSAAGKDNMPAVYVTWYGADEFARQAGGSLPTEAQWEYACRAGKSGPFGLGDGGMLDYTMANFNWKYPYKLPDGEYDENYTYSKASTAVGSYAPNDWGLYDMHGNVYEWCSDWYSVYGAGAQQDPQGAQTGIYKVQRGGSFGENAKSCRSACRYYKDPEVNSRWSGFRIVFVP